VYGEGGIVGWEIRVGEGSGKFRCVEAGVVDLDVVACSEVCGEEEGSGGVGEERDVGVVGARCAVIDSDLSDAVGGTESGVPAADGAVERGEEEGGSGAVGQLEVGCRGAEDGAGGQACAGTSGVRDGHLEGDGSSGGGDVVEAGYLGVDPEGRPDGNAPGIDELRICNGGGYRSVGQDVGGLIGACGLG
jgi:hypothetical protein